MTSLIKVGKIVNTHGVRGEVKVLPYSEDPQRFKQLKHVYLIAPAAETGEKLDILRCKLTNQTVVLQFPGIDGCRLFA